MSKEDTTPPEETSEDQKKPRSKHLLRNILLGVGGAGLIGGLGYTGYKAYKNAPGMKKYYDERARKLKWRKASELLGMQDKTIKNMFRGGGSEKSRDGTILALESLIDTHKKGRGYINLFGGTDTSYQDFDFNDPRYGEVKDQLIARFGTRADSTGALSRINGNPGTKSRFESANADGGILDDFVSEAEKMRQDTSRQGVSLSVVPGGPIGIKQNPRIANQIRDLDTPDGHSSDFISSMDFTSGTDKAKTFLKMLYK